MNAMKAVAGGLVVAAGFLFGTEPAQAGPKGFGGGTSTKFSGGFRNTNKFHDGFGNPSFHGGHGFHGGLSGPIVPIHKHRWHDTSHFDYHPGRWVWNGFRWVYVPGHYDFHRTGHFDHARH